MIVVTVVALIVTLILLYGYLYWFNYKIQDPEDVKKEEISERCAACKHPCKGGK